MSKTTYTDRFEKASKFYDQAYHHHKATFKGSAEFFNKYCDVEKSYANDLVKLSQNITDYISDMKKELPHIQENISEICNNMGKISQFHFTYGQRLKEIAEICRQQYLFSKKKKQKQSQEEHQKVKQQKNKTLLQTKQKQICKRIIDHIDEYMDDEVNRAQKFKEQIIIYFSITKKIAEKQIQLASAYSLKMAKYQIQVKVPQVDTLEQNLVDQFNGYGDQQIQKKNRDINKQISVHRSSLKDSIIKRQKQQKVESYSNQINKLIDKFKEDPEELNYPEVDKPQVGFFDIKTLPNYRSFTSIISSQAVKQISYTWFVNHYHNTPQAAPLLKIIKTNLKTKEKQLKRVTSCRQFIQQCYTVDSYKPTVRMMHSLSEIYAGRSQPTQLAKMLQQKQIMVASSLHWRIQIVIIDCLLEGAIVIKDGYSILQRQYTQVLNLVIGFAKIVFSMDAGVVVMMLLRKLQRTLEVVMSTEQQNIQQIFEMNIDYGGDHPDTYLMRMDLGHSLIHFLTKNMSHFYSVQMCFSNLVKISLVVQKILPKNYFSAIEHMHACIKKAGFNYLLECDQDKKVVEPGVWRGQQRLKNLAMVLEQMSYDQIRQTYLDQIAKELSILVGVGAQVISKKMMKQFMNPMHEIVKVNMDILSEQEAVDQDGYILRLGICLAELDSLYPQEISYYGAYFNVLDKYMASTQQEYHSMLEHSCKTQVWMVMDQNCQATQNCFDFCSLLYKPFEFLLESLKKLEVEKQQTAFIKEFNQFIKTKLNKALKDQIQKYLIFLYKSLDSLKDRPPVMDLKPKWLALHVTGSDQLSKTRFQFCQVTRRLFNLIFLKDKLEEIMSDFLDKQVHQSIGHSVFNVQKLKQIASRPGPYRSLIDNISRISNLIVQNQVKLVQRVADITVYHFMKHFFNNLYFQQERSFFSNGPQKLSQYTFVKNQQEISGLLDMVAKNIPLENHDQFCVRFCRSLFKIYRVQLINIHKFKSTIKRPQVVAYIQTDIAFLNTLLKKSFVDNKIVQQQIERPLKRILMLIEAPTQKLMDEFTDANIGNKDQQEAKCCLGLLNLREGDSKAQQFVQKYKKLVK